VPGLEDLYLAGDWVGPEGFLVDASAASARRAARSVLENLTPTERAIFCRRSSATITQR
jgi:uncharacterized protein with NAD-binding domain and iron-sulfur cluster